jgi:aminoglycoside phosphotransferase (APT) family kinase protein
MRDQHAAREHESRVYSPLAHEVHAVLTSELDHIAWPQPCFVHDDFWPGNTIWYRDRLVAIIDWSPAEVGDPRADVSQFRSDVNMIHSAALADAFTDAYQRLAPRPLPDLWYFDLHRGLGALLQHEEWQVGYTDAGIDLTPAVARRRIEAFLERALAERPRR